MKRNKEKDDKLQLSFIVRFYRFVGNGPVGIVGVVETVVFEDLPASMNFAQY
jgi:hypothetical protein